MYRAGDKVVTTNLVPAASLADARIQVEIVRRSVRDIFLNDAPAKEAALQRMAAADAAVDAAIDAYLPLAADPDAVRQFQADWAAYKQARDATLVPAARGDDLPAFISAAAVVGPLAVKAGDELAVAARAEAADGLKTAAHAKDAYESGRTAMIVVLSIGVLLALGLALYAARSIVAPLRRVSVAIEAIAAGNLTATADVHTRDEIGVMAAALDAANARTRAAIGAVANTANTLAASSEELSASSASRSPPRAEETVGAGRRRVRPPPSEVSRNVQTVAAGCRGDGRLDPGDRARTPTRRPGSPARP